METSRTNPFDGREELAEELATPGHAEVAHIKEWVTEKLAELEEQNSHLKAENRRFTEELAKLKKCYTSTKNKAYTPEVRRKVMAPTTPLGGRRPRTGRRYNSSQRLDSTSSTEDEDEFFGTRKRNVTSRFQQQHNQQPRPSPRRQRQQPQANNETIVGPTIEGDSIRLLSGATRPLGSRSGAGSLDRKLTKMKRFNFVETKTKQSSADTQNLYDIVGGSSDLPQQQPPTPPRHQCPSWESRIYSVANSFFSQI